MPRGGLAVALVLAGVGALGTGLALADEGSSPSCSISPSNPSINAGGSVNWSVGSRSGFPSSGTWRYAWVFQGGNPNSSTSSSRTVSYANGGTFTTTLVLSRGYRTSATCSTTVTVNATDTQQTCSISVNPTSLAFGDVNVGQSASLSTTVSNAGTAACSVTFSGLAQGSDFSTPTSLSVAPNSSQIVSVTYTPGQVGGDTNTLVVSSNDPNTPTVNVSLSGNGVSQPQAQCNPPQLGQGQDVSINSTSQNGCPDIPVTEQPFATQGGFNILASNDLGMHCGDLDTRISSILPPFNVVHSQVIQRGSEPRILTPADGVEVVYSAASNPTDPILVDFGNVPGAGTNSAGTGPVASSVLPDGSVYKTNFWDIAYQAYDPFYPSGILALFYDAGNATNNLDLGLPMPNVERFYLGDGRLGAEQQEMNGRSDAYVANTPLSFNIFTIDQPFFTGFPFGYTKDGVNWFEAAGIPMTAFADYGRENPWPLMRVQAKSGGNVIASLDTVLPISGEANCGECHNAPGEVVYQDGSTNSGAATASLTTVTSVLDDTANVPFNVSLEWAADQNILRLHDENHGTHLIVGTTMDGGTTPFEPVVCQRCHYTPALDLAQLGPLGPENDTAMDVTLDDGSANGVLFHVDSLANGRDQVKNKSMSNVMHSHHGTMTDGNGKKLFPDMPPAVDASGNLRDPVAARDILNQTCYQCHPGRRTDCLRGAMASGGMLCQDCHGNMEQVGDDFTRNVSPTNVGAFDLGPDFYTNASTPRVPWANEPGCGSCHTGDANDNMHNDPDTLGDPDDGIRLMQAYRISDNATNGGKATPIVPTNKRFAENTVATGPAAGNPMLYRESTGHGGVFCEGCHGATHGIWPNKNPGANDNVAANQLQGHSGVIIECSTCHGTAMDSRNTLDGPHGMHPVGANTSFARGGHENLAESNSAACSVCHGPGGRSSNVGTVLSAAKADRTLRGTLVRAGEPVGCSVCHGSRGG